MEIFDELTYYSRMHFENAKNVGFVDYSKFNDTNARITDHLFIEKLKKFIKYPFNMVRAPFSEIKTMQYDNEIFSLGFSEIRVIGCDGTIYASPDIVIYHILNGGYAPPKEFIDAVIYGVDPESEEYKQYISRYNARCFWGASEKQIHNIEVLCKCLESKDLNELERLLDSSPELIDTVTQNGSILNAALLLDQVNMAKLIIDKGISLELFSGVELLTATEKGMVEVVEILLRKGTPIRYDLPRNNPLFLATAIGKNEVAKKLYQTRKDLVRIYCVDSIRECNILQWAKIYQNFEFIQFLENPYN